MNYETLVVATDGSDCANAASERAVDLARRFDATLHALYVVDQSVAHLGSWDVVVEEQELEGERALDEIGERAAAEGVHLEKHLRRGVPEDQIVDFADDHNADAIVMGTCGRKGFQRLAHAGSTTERVVRNSSIPVFVVPPERS